MSTKLTSTGKTLKVDRIVRVQGNDSFRVASPTCAGLFVGSKACEQAVEFQPRVSGAHNATFELYDESNRKIGTFQAEGRAISATIAVAPPALDFTNGPRQQQITVQSQGDAPLRLTAVRVEGSPAFNSSGGGCRDLDLPRGGSCTFPVTFAASTAGNAELVEATLLIEHNATDGVTRVPLRRTQVLLARLVVDSNPINFGSVNLGQSATLQALVRNMGNAPSGALNVTLQREPNPYSLAGTCGAPLEPGATCTVDVTFAPPAEGKFDNRLIVTDGTLQFGTLEITGVGVRVPIN